MCAVHDSLLFGYFELPASFDFEHVVKMPEKSQPNHNSSISLGIAEIAKVAIFEL